MPRTASRRRFLRAATASAVAAATAARAAPPARAAGRAARHGPKLPDVRPSRYSTDERPNSWHDITSYNNFYEFAGSDDKDLPSLLAPDNLIVAGWRVVVEGECASPGTYTLADILRGQRLEERVYRHRCVEAWSMVIPWVGFSLADFVERCRPTARATYIQFDSHYDPVRMPRSRRLPFDWPYREGLRMDEAMHPLAILAVGLHGEGLPHQNGAPIRLVVPWKYGFKSIKSIVRIRFVERRPVGTYQQQQPRAYGFYANVNPAVHHPQWSQATERRVGTFFRRKTLMFNGYAREVASLYAGMDLTADY